MSKIQDTNGVDNPGFRSEPGDVIIPLEKATERLTYSWENLNIFASVTQGCGRKKTVTEKHILKDVTGICRPGELLAIMGASGAGKTTLLNALTFRSDAALKIKGSLYVNGRKVTPTLLTSRSAYVQQDDLFIGTMTVKEQLVFQANLRMDKDIPTHRRMERVEEVMKELSLVKCAGTLIGIPGRIKGISGGEMKRLAFACEMLTNPPLMFCDEPTTGLDSFMARNIVQAMRNMAQHGKTIISTIHQPSSEVFEQFDRVLLMAEGRVAFLGSTEGALDFFKGLGHHCPENFNPADFFISTLAIQPGEEEACRELSRVPGACGGGQHRGPQVQVWKLQGLFSRRQLPTWQDERHLVRHQEGRDYEHLHERDLQQHCELHGDEGDQDACLHHALQHHPHQHRKTHPEREQPSRHELEVGERDQQRP